MTRIDGLVGLRPDPAQVATITAPPYDVIKPGSPLEALLAARAESVYHVTLGADPGAALERLCQAGHLRVDEEPAYYVYEQRWQGGERLGVFAATEVSDYSARQIIRHEKTFDDKVQGRIALARATGHTTGPVFLLTRSPIQDLLHAIRREQTPLYDFVSDFAGHGDLHGIHSRVFRLPAASDQGRQLQALIGRHPLYIADGHHRYHAALKNGQSHLLAYIVEEAHIQAYNRVCTGQVPFLSIVDQLDLEPVDHLQTPPKHAFCLAYRGGWAMLRARQVPTDVVGRLDCAILERELYPLLGLDHSMIVDPQHFDYYAESQLDLMQDCVDTGRYDLAIALHPVSIDDLMAVADAGLDDPEIVMPEKSTFFAPKILTGLFFYRHGRDG